MNHSPLRVLNHLIIGSLLLSVSQLSALRYTDIDVEFASLATDSWDLTDSGVVYKEKNIDHNAVSKPYLSTWTKDGYERSLKFQASPITPDPDIKQRVEYYAYRDAPLPFHKAIYVGFHFNVVAAASDIQDWTLIMQCQQLGEYVSPFLAFQLEDNNGQLEFVVSIRNTTHYGIHGVTGPDGHSSKIYRHPIVSRNWNSVLLGVYPDPSGDGEVVLYIDDELVLDWTGPLGFPQGFLGYPFVEEFQNTFGLYRQSQNSTVKVYFDNYRIADVPFSAAP